MSDGSGITRQPTHLVVDEELLGKGVAIVGDLHQRRTLLDLDASTERSHCEESMVWADFRMRFVVSNGMINFSFKEKVATNLGQDGNLYQ